MKYRKKSVEVDAIQITEGAQHQIEDYCGVGADYSSCETGEFLGIGLEIEGQYAYASNKSWVVKRGWSIELHSDDTFKKIYEKVTE